MDIKSSEFLSALITQLRAMDQFGSWSSMSDEELLVKKYVKTKEDLKNIPLIADIDEIVTKEIRLIFQAVATIFEKKTAQMCSVVMEMSHEGFGRVLVTVQNVVLIDKHFRDAHRFGYKDLEKLEADGAKMVEKSLAIYEKFKALNS